MLVKQANSFKSIDNALETEKDQHTLTQLFEKKNKLLALVQGGQLTADKYLQICKKTMTDSTIEAVKDATEMELIGLGDDVGAWFRDVLDETNDKLDDQKKMMAKLGVKAPPPPQKAVAAKQPEPKMEKKPSERQSVKPIQKTIEKPSPSSSTAIDATKIYSLKALDTLMDENEQNKQLYMGLYQQKQKIAALIRQKKITPQIYLQTIEKLLATSNNEDIKFAVQMEIEELKDFHAGNVDEWFRDRIQTTEEEREKQKNKYSVFKTGKAVAKKTDDVGIDIEVDTLANNIANRAKKVNVSLKSNIKPFCFKYLDDELQKSQQNPKAYIELYEEKLKCLELIKSEQVSAEDYRDMLASIAEESTKQLQDMKTAAEMEIDLHDLTGDIMEFFQSSIEETGAKYEEQEKMYNKFTAGKGQKLNLNTGTSEKKPQQMPKIEKEPRPDISDIVSFTVLANYLEKYKKDYDYCTELKEKGSKLLKLVDDKKLSVNAYMKFLETKLGTSKDQETVAIMQKQYKKLASLKDNEKELEKEYKLIVGDYLNKIKVNLGSRNSYDSEVFINEMTINEAEPKIKIEYLLRKLGRHESLYVYYRNNKMEGHLKAFEKSYLATKKDTLNLCEKIKAKEGKDIGVDLHEFVEKNLPDISFAVLHRQSRTSYNEKIAPVVQKIKKANAKLAEYTKTLKKGTNKNNIEQGMKMIEQNNKTIAYLQVLKNEDYVPFPLIEETKTQMYNLDLNKNLTENEIEIKVVNFQGIKDHLLFRIYMVDRKQPRFEANVADGPQSNISVIMKIPPEIMEDIIKGSDKKYLAFTLVSKGWFSQKVVCQADLQLNFIRTNRMEDRLVLKHQKIFMDYIINVLKPKKPLVTEIPTIKVTQYPRYEHNDFVAKEFIKTIMPFEKPTQSEIVS